MLLSPGPSALSTRLTKAVLESDLDATLKLVAIAIVFPHASEANGNCVWPGIERVCWLTSFSKRCIQQSIDRLEAMGFLEAQDVRTGRGAVRGWAVFPDKLSQRSPWQTGAVFGRRQVAQSQLFHREERVHDVHPFTTDVAPFQRSIDGSKGATSFSKGATSCSERGDVVPPEVDLEGTKEENHRRSAPASHPQTPEQKPAAAPFRVCIELASLALKLTQQGRSHDEADALEHYKTLVRQKGIAYSGDRLAQKAIRAARRKTDRARSELLKMVGKKKLTTRRNNRRARA